MKIRVGLSGYFKHKAGGVTHIDVVLQNGQNTARDAVIQAGLPPGEIGFIQLHGVLSSLDAVITDGDSFTVYPEILGG